MKSERQKPIWLTVLIAVFGIVIGFLGELMPDKLKENVETWSAAKFGVSYMTVWCIVTAIIVLFFIWLIWKEAAKPSTPDEKTPNNTRNIHQHGEKSVYIEKNEGPININ